MTRVLTVHLHPLSTASAVPVLVAAASDIQYVVAQHSSIISSGVDHSSYDRFQAERRRKKATGKPAKET